MINPTRRRLLGSVAVAIAMAASPALAQNAMAQNAIAQNAAVKGAITVMGYSGLFAENYTKYVINPFMQLYPAVKVSFRQITNSGEGLALLRVQKGHPSIDVAIMDVAVAITGGKEGLFAPMDPAKVPNLADIPAWGHMADNTGAALSLDNLAIIYNTNLVKFPITSWTDLQRPEFKGKLAMTVADTRGVVMIPVLDRMSGVDYKSGNIDPAIAALKKIAPNVQTWEPLPEVYTAVESGQVAAGIGWNGRGQFTEDDSNGVVKVAIPKEGSVGQTNTINFVAGSASPDAAQAFINYALGVQAQTTFAEKSYYGPTNSKVKLPQALELRIFGDAATAKAQMPLDWNWLATRYSPWVQRIKREVIGG